MGGSDELSNLVTLCDGCHAAHHPNLAGGLARRVSLWSIIGCKPLQIGDRGTPYLEKLKAPFARELHLPMHVSNTKIQGALLG